jgi:hypothetical protein
MAIRNQEHTLQLEERDYSPAVQDPHLRLAAAVVLQALIDWRQSRDPLLSLDAFGWLVGEDAALITEALDLPDAWNMVLNGRENAPSNKNTGTRRQ